ncbi:MAG: sugar nucleotide-binding protein [Deltaproteobacteria bacterium]|nr:sugar nucleotide-binding protein [Deltaproteobacteria bacterium]
MGSNYCLKASKAGHDILGVDLRNRFKPDGCSTASLDIREERACKDICESFKPQAIIHTARAPGSLWEIEKNRIAAYRTNVIGTKNLLRCAEDLKATFVFFSTDWVFDGTKGLGEGYKENDEVGPLNYYGVTKCLGEHAVGESSVEWLIIRPAHIYGVHGAVLKPGPKNNLGLLEGSVWSRIWQAIQSEEKVKIPDDMHQTPVYVNHLVDTSMKLLERGFRGVYHVADRDCHTRYRVTRDVLKTLGLDSRRVEKGLKEDFARSQSIPEDLVGILPENTCLDVSKIERDLGMRMPTFEEGLELMAREVRTPEGN